MADKIPYTIQRHYSCLTPITVEIGAEFEASPEGVKLGAAVKVAFKGGAVLSSADLRGADLRGVPKIPNIDATILAAIEAGGALEMDTWHTCETTHCRAGWAITLAGDAGRALEFALGSAAAGALIYAASDPDRPIPDFYASNEEALADLKARAAAQELRAALAAARK